MKMKKFDHIKDADEIGDKVVTPWQAQCVAFSMPYVSIQLGKKYGNVLWSDRTLPDDVRAYLKECSQAILDCLLNIAFRYKNPQSTCKISFDECMFFDVDHHACEALASDVFDFLNALLSAQIRAKH
ncbi:hypothetical protein SAMN04515620_13438 [Collimonas sp. OK607]|uniref:hypothetical protein n=1 Tax=Collimonas sp. OK607 TaxID=1798194 RepID=UPI0008E2AF3C|nr:hypothetical protein [Collimonas sp. OK607]SFB27881.1 hypothetical protein SAMN04515620_13438 [Collimonas sp. OK607]